METVELKFQVKGITCSGCISTIEKSLSKFPEVQKVLVHSDPPSAEISALKALDLRELNRTLSEAGNYSLLPYQPSTNTPSEIKKGTYRPLILIFGFLVLATLLAQLNGAEFNIMQAMKHFMGGFFLVFSFFKFLDLRGFATTYKGYDLIAAAWPPYGYVYPFLELILGVLYLGPWSSPLIYWFTLLLMGVSTAGVARVLVKGQTLQCACLGTVFDLPMSTVTLVEDLLMVVMAAAMLLFAG